MTDQHHRFSYQFVDSTRFLRPYIPVTLRTGSITLEPILALVDSGADFSIFDGELSYLLDIDLTKLKTISLAGINGKAEGYVTHLEIGIEHTFISVPVVFSFDFSPQGFGGVVGQLGFFDNFIVQFDRPNTTVVLK